MEGGAESPLDVLSRAATMVQENQQAAEESAKQSNKQLPTTKWKRDRRSRLPEYSRKSDPKLPDNWDPQAPPSPESVATQNGFNGTGGTTTNGSSLGESCNNGPLDMSVRQRGQPPSYSQTVNNPGYRSNYRPSVIQNRDDPPPGSISMCDPIIDEHFRRSLGNDYLALFSNNNVSKEIPKSINNKSPPPAPPPPPPLPPTPPLLQPQPPTAPVALGTTNNERSVIELMDSEGLSVDDHFAKALGDTWTKLNKEKADLKSNPSENLVST